MATLRTAIHLLLTYSSDHSTDAGAARALAPVADMDRKAAAAIDRRHRLKDGRTPDRYIDAYYILCGQRQKCGLLLQTEWRGMSVFVSDGHDHELCKDG